MAVSGQWLSRHLISHTHQRSAQVSARNISSGAFVHSASNKGSGAPMNSKLKKTGVAAFQHQDGLRPVRLALLKLGAFPGKRLPQPVPTRAFQIVRGNKPERELARSSPYERCTRPVQHFECAIESRWRSLNEIARHVRVAHRQDSVRVPVAQDARGHANPVNQNCPTRVRAWPCSWARKRRSGIAVRSRPEPDKGSGIFVRMWRTIRFATTAVPALDNLVSGEGHVQIGSRPEL